MSAARPLTNSERFRQWLCAYTGPGRHKSLPIGSWRPSVELKRSQHHRAATASAVVPTACSKDVPLKRSVLVPRCLLEPGNRRFGHAGKVVSQQVTRTGLHPFG